jgi:hypothetical protein
MTPVSEQAGHRLDRLLAETRLARGYVPATTADAALSEALFERLLRGEQGADIAEGLARIGFTLASVTLGGEAATVIREAAGQRTGKGLYVLRQGAGRPTPVLLQAPHRFTDLDTGRIVARLLEEGGFLAAAWNTVPRWYEDGGVRIDADLAHVEVSHFNAFTRAFAKVHGRSRVIQIHGFERARRRSGAGAQAGVIVSSGTGRPGSASAEVARCLEGALTPERVLLYPVDVKELGGTTNANAAALRELKFDGFVHIEVARELRIRLRDDEEARKTFARCLG